MGTTKYIMFQIEENWFAVDLFSIDKVFRAAALMTVPQAPEFVLGLINIAGKIIPVIDIRRRLRLPMRELDIRDRIVIARVSGRSAAFIVDEIAGVMPLSDDRLEQSTDIYPEMGPYVKGVGKFEDRTALIFDVSVLFDIPGMYNIHIRNTDDTGTNKNVPVHSG
jgi:purine-binding chemotaxis protein CheW